MIEAKKIIYLDYASTTPVDPAVIKSMQDCLGLNGYFANPASNTHILGRQANERVEKARRQVASILNADPREIIFTSGATEANNLAIKGLAQFYRAKGRHIVTAMTEHKAVLDTCKALEKQGFSVTYLRPNRQGIITLEQLAKAINSDTILVSLMQVNNETGCIQDINTLSRWVKSKGIYFHTDAAQSIGKLPLDVQQTPVDLISICGHKIYAPKGVGVLYARRVPKVRLIEQMSGGQHEHGRRSGTLATHQIVALGEALHLAQQQMQTEQKRLSDLRALFLTKINKLEDIKVNGAPCLPNVLSLTFPYVDSETLMARCPQLAFSAGSACNSTSIIPSHVLQAMGLTAEQANNTIRISFGRFTQEADIKFSAELLVQQVNWIRSINPLYLK